MNLLELQAAVNLAVECAKDNHENPEEIQVTLQIDESDGTSVWSREDLEVNYDGGGMVSGCVLSAYRDGKSV